MPSFGKKKYIYKKTEDTSFKFQIHINVDLV